MSQDTSPICFHCGLEIPKGVSLHVEISNEMQAMCCAGCEAVAQAIVDAGRSSFYNNRTAYSNTANNLVPDFLTELKVYDNQEIQKSFVRVGTDNIREASLLLEGITCAACVWLNERHLEALPGVVSVQINYATHRALVKWDNQTISLSNILAAIRSIGFIAHPYDPNQQQSLLQKEGKAQLKRLGVAGIMGMQIMTISVALYLGAWTGIDEAYKNLFRWAGLLFVIPILVYSAQPFYIAAWRDVKTLRLGMDVPVSIGISIAFIGSVIATWTRVGDVYYDSIGMFVFFLAVARFFEFKAREQSADASERLTRVTPTTTRKLDLENNKYARIAVVDLQLDDTIKVYAGEVIPTDGVILDGESGVNESLLTGESLPRLCIPGDLVIGGSINTESPLIIQVNAIGQDTVLSNLLSLMEKAQGEKPKIALLANKVASWFVLFILATAIIAGSSWYYLGNEHWLEIVIALLVVTCPCALSLATPVALTAATGALSKKGMILSGGSVIESLSKLDDIIFDKTGTLTDGRLNLIRIINYSDLAEDELLSLAAVIEQDSEHLLGKALKQQAQQRDLVINAVTLRSSKNFPGQGVTAEFDNSQYAIGSHDFVVRQNQVSLSDQELLRISSDGASVVLLAKDSKILAAFLLADEIRIGAETLLEILHSLKVKPHLYTGDTEQAALRVSQSLGITDVRFKMTPEKKLQQMQNIQKSNKLVAMMGDGINDALVLAGANVSIAMGNAAGLAKLNADVVLSCNSLRVLSSGFLHAKKTVRIIHQNLGWALMYNLLAVPTAALGYVAPWMAAIGMSLSSLFVVLNSSRLRSVVKTREFS